MRRRLRAKQLNDGKIITDIATAQAEEKAVKVINETPEKKAEEKNDNKRTGRKPKAVNSPD